LHCSLLVLGGLLVLESLDEVKLLLPHSDGAEYGDPCKYSVLGKLLLLKLLDLAVPADLLHGGVWRAWGVVQELHEGVVQT
jgi:hypothetical protein